jgi:hypothetical protein
MKGSMSAIGTKRTSRFTVVMYVFDPKRTLGIGGAAIKPNEVRKGWLPAELLFHPELQWHRWSAWAVHGSGKKVG